MKRTSRSNPYIENVTKLASPFRKSSTIPDKLGAPINDEILFMIEARAAVNKHPLIAALYGIAPDEDLKNFQAVLTFACSVADKVEARKAEITNKSKTLEEIVDEEVKKALQSRSK